MSLFLFRLNLPFGVLSIKPTYIYKLCMERHTSEDADAPPPPSLSNAGSRNPNAHNLLRMVSTSYDNHLGNTATGDQIAGGIRVGRGGMSQKSRMPKSVALPPASTALPGPTVEGFSSLP